MLEGTIAALSSDELSVTFAPQSEVDAHAELVAGLCILDDLTAVVAHTVPLLLTAASAFSSFQLEPAGCLRFPPVAAGGSLQRMVTLRNTGRFAFDFSIETPRSMLGDGGVALLSPLASPVPSGRASATEAAGKAAADGVAASASTVECR
jgi:hypothetical protein